MRSVRLKATESLWSTGWNGWRLNRMMSGAAYQESYTGAFHHFGFASGLLLTASNTVRRDPMMPLPISSSRKLGLSSHSLNDRSNIQGKSARLQQAGSPDSRSRPPASQEPAEQGTRLSQGTHPMGRPLGL